MKKPFKKAVAVLLAVLMCAFSVPFTALAAPGDYEPDIELQFGTFHADDATDWRDYNSNAAGKTFTVCGPFDVPLDYNAKAGTLTLSKAKTDTAIASYPELGFANLDADYTYGVGDYFVATACLDDVSELLALSARLKYSDNIEPAGYYSYSAGRKTAYALGTVSEAAAKKGTFVTGGYKEVADFSSCTFYNLDQENGDAIVDYGYGYVMDVYGVTPDGATVDISSLTNQYFCNPETGDLSAGYTYTGRAIIASYVFKITGEGPITFECADPYNTTGYGTNGNLDFGGGYYAANDVDGANLQTTTTVAPMYWDGKKGASCTATYREGLIEAPGSAKMKFFGVQPNRQTPPSTTEYTVTFKYADHSVASQATYAEGTAAADVVVPTNTAASQDAANHYTYAWPAVADVTADATYEEVKTTTPHSYTSEVTKEATCGEDGVRTYTCTVGSEPHSYTEPIPATNNHTAGTPVETVIQAATCGAEGSKKVVTKCSVCDTVMSEETVAIPATGKHTWDAGRVTKEPTETETGIMTYECTVCHQTKTEDIPVKEHVHKYSAVVTAPTCTQRGYTTYTCACSDSYVSDYVDALGHNFDTNGDGTVDEKDGVVTTAAKCEEDGVRTYTCTRNCGETGYTYTEAIPATGHTPGEEVVTIIKEAKCTEKGEKNTTVKCTECNKVLSSVNEEIEKLGHNFVKGETVAPTIRAEGYTLYECSRCDATDKRDIVPALGVNVTVAATDLGEVTGLATGVNNVAYGTEYTLTATALDGAQFDGWEINGKIVSTDATYTSTAVNDVTITPLFSEVSQNTITVKFADPYGNVFATFTGTPEEVAAAVAASTPVAPVMDGYTFVGWSQDITSFTESTTVVAKYEVSAQGYTVTTSGTLTLPADVTNGAIPYDTAVTVYAEGATAWVVDGVKVGYGDTYTFFVGSDITIEPVFDAVTAVPTVNIVSANQISGSHKVSFLATRNVPDGYVLVNAGFVYGKNLTDADLDLDNVGKNGAAAEAGVVKVAYASKTGADQFALNYGITAQVGTASAKAFVVVKKGATTSVIYSDAQLFTY